MLGKQIRPFKETLCAFKVIRDAFWPKPNDLVVVNEFWGMDRYVEALVRYPDNSRMVDLSVVNGNVGHGMTGFYHDGKWYSEDWQPITKTHFKEIKVTVVGWRELEAT